MTNYYSTTISEERKRGQHLGSEQRGVIQVFKKLGYSNCAIAREINCSPSTVGYELKRGTPEYVGRGRRAGYSAKLGAAVYRQNRSRCRRSKIVSRDTAFMKWMVKMVHMHKWSFDTCVGRARQMKLFPEHEIPCTKTLYQLLWNGELPLTLFELPEVLTRRKQGIPRISKRKNGKGIELRPQEVLERDTFGHWESDTVLERKHKGEPAVFTIVERLTGYYISLKIDAKTMGGVSAAMELLHQQYGKHFPEVFRTITTDNGSEFADFSSAERYGCEIYFAEPYAAWERPVNERTNHLLRRFTELNTI